MGTLGKKSDFCERKKPPQGRIGTGVDTVDNNTVARCSSCVGTKGDVAVSGSSFFLGRQHYPSSFSHDCSCFLFLVVVVVTLVRPKNVVSFSVSTARCFCGHSCHANRARSSSSSSCGRFSIFVLRLPIVVVRYRPVWASATYCSSVHPVIIVRLLRCWL